MRIEHLSRKMYHRIMPWFLVFPIIISLFFACTMTSDTERDYPGKETVRTGAESIERGKILFDSQCAFCHATGSTETIVGPGLKGILKKPQLPASKKPSTPGNIVIQLKQPYRDMPLFSHLSEDDVLDIIAYLNTL
jgi:mono/diheme cytochrome c family protein